MRIGKYQLKLFDKYNWVIVEDKVHEKGKKYEYVVGYYRNLELASYALLELFNKNYSSNNLGCSIEDIIESIDESKKLIADSIALSSRSRND